MNYKIGVTKTLLRVAGNRIGLFHGGSVEKPVILEFMITTKCDCRCVMCNIWKKDAKSDLSLREIQELLEDPILSDLRTMTLAGGEPFQRSDILELAQLINSKCKNLIQLYLSTNGFDHVGILNKVTSILNIMANIKRLRIAVSFDHIGERHDNIRGQKGIHQNALALVHNLKKIGDPRLSVQGNFTIAPHNVNDIYDIYKYFYNMGLKVFWFPIMTSDNFFENEGKTNNFSFNPSEKAKLIDFIAFLRRQELSMPDFYYYSGLLTSLRNNVRSFPCSAGTNFLMINSVGDIYPCYIFPKKWQMGTVRNKSLAEIWDSEPAREIRAKICNNPTCARCIQWYDGYALSHSLKYFSQLVLTHPIRTINHLVRH